MVYGIVEDEAGFLWLSTNKGLSRFDPRLETFRNFETSYGLQSSEFNQGSYFESPIGEMFFGGVNGFNAFYPEQVRDNPTTPAVVLTALTQGGEDVGAGTAVENLTAAIEPMMMVFLGVVIGGLVVSMYLPIFKMASGLG